MIHFGKPRPGGPQLPPPQIGGEEFAAARIYQKTGGPAFDDPQLRTMAAPVPGRERAVMDVMAANNLDAMNRTVGDKAIKFVGDTQGPQQAQKMLDRSRVEMAGQYQGGYSQSFAQEAILKQLGPQGAEPIQRLGALAMEAGL